MLGHLNTYFLMRNLNFWSKIFILRFWSSQCLRLLRPCNKPRGQKKSNQHRSINIHKILKQKQPGSAWLVDTIRHLLSKYLLTTYLLKKYLSSLVMHIWIFFMKIWHYRTEKSFYYLILRALRGWEFVLLCYWGAQTTRWFDSWPFPT